MAYSLSPDQFVDYLIEHRGLVTFVEQQLAGKPASTWTKADWQDITVSIWHLSERMWQPSPAYVIDMYMLQKERSGRWELHPDSQVEKWKARYAMWKDRALTAEAELSKLRSLRRAKVR